MRIARTTAVIGSTLRRATTLALAVLLAGALTLAGNGARDDTTAADTYPVSARMLATHGVRIVQANIKSGMSADRIAADLERVYTKAPDFITYNEVPGVPDDLLAASGYAIQRTPGTYTGSSPVVWNAQRFTRINSGTYMISNKWGKTSKQVIHLGVRYANWVTVRENATGQVLSVIAVHFAPDPGPYTTGLRGPSYKRMGALMTQLGAYGPVFAGGDVNTGYNGTGYPRDMLTSLGIVANYDLTHVVPGTYYGHGATIDHIYLHKADGVPITGQTTTVMNSDHRMLTVDVGNVVDAATPFPTGWLISNPRTAPLVTMKLIAKVLYRAPKGSVMHLYSKYLDSPRIWRSVKRAKARGVHIQVITGNKRTTTMDKRLAALLGTNVRKKSWFARKPNFSRYGLPVAGILASSSGGTPAVRVDLNRALTVKAVKKSIRARTKTNRFAYDRVFVSFFRAVGIKV